VQVEEQKKHQEQEYVVHGQRSWNWLLANIKGSFSQTESKSMQGVFEYASATWAMKLEDMARLERTERMMVRLMCGVHLNNRAELNNRFGIECITDVIRRSRLRWFGHVEIKDSDDWVSACRSFEVNGVRYRGRGRKTWDECVKKDLVELGLH